MTSPVNSEYFAAHDRQEGVASFYSILNEIFSLIAWDTSQINQGWSVGIWKECGKERPHASIKESFPVLHETIPTICEGKREIKEAAWGKSVSQFRKFKVRDVWRRMRWPHSQNAKLLVERRMIGRDHVGGKWWPHSPIVCEWARRCVGRPHALINKILQLLSGRLVGRWVHVGKWGSGLREGYEWKRWGPRSKLNENLIMWERKVRWIMRRGPKT